MNAEPGLLLHDDARHGVSRYARELSDTVERATRRALAVPERLWTRGDAPERIHVQFTDRLWGHAPEVAASRLEALALGRHLSVTLHDVPQPSDGRAFARRVEAYRRVLAVAGLVVVNSQHELALLRESGLVHPGTIVIPLPAGRREDVSSGGPFGGPVDGHRPPAVEPTAAILGFIYPGKGHRETLDALAIAGTGLTFTALGTPSPGHADVVEELMERGRSIGVEVRVSGYLTDDLLTARARAIAVPVVAHQHFSASGSINSWIAAGRRPLVLRNRYTEEMARLRPDTLTLVGLSELPAAIAAAVVNPSSTFLDEATSARPHLADIAAAYLRAWRGAGA